MRARVPRTVMAGLAASLTLSGVAISPHWAIAASLPITITMPAAGNATLSNAQYSSQDVYPGVVTGVATPPSGITPLQRLAALNPPNFRIHAGTDGGSTTVALPFNAAYTSSDAVHVNAWDFNNLNSLVANTVGLTSGPTVINVRYAPDNMFTGSGPMGGNATAPGVLIDQTYAAFATYMANLVKYYNTSSPPAGATPPRPAGVGPIRYWEVWNEPDFASENPRIPPTLPPPGGVTLSSVAVAGGTLSPGTTYIYRITPLTSSNAEGLPSTAVPITLASGANAVKITWNASTNLGRLAAAYTIYGRSGTVGQLVVVGKDNPAGLSWTDTGSIAPGGAPPATDSTLAGPVFSPLEYKALWDKAVPAMKAVDPTIKVVGPVATIGGSVITTAVTTGPSDGSYLDNRNYVQMLMTSANQPDVISFHGYGGFQGAADSDSSLMGAGMDYIVNDVLTNVRPYSGTTPIWQTEANVNSGDDSTNRPALAFGAAWDASLFAKLAPVGVSTIHQYTYVNSSTFGLITEPGSSVPGAVEGNPYLPYWVEYWIDHMFAPGAKILSVANVPAGFDVLAVANPPDFTKVKVLVVNRQVPATNTAASVLLAGATSTATRVRVIDSTTDLVNGPAVSNLGAVQTGNLQLNGYSVGLMEFDTGTGIAFTGGPDVSSWGSGHLDLFARGTDNALWQRTYDAAQGGWTSWTSLGGILSSDPSATSWGPGHIDVFVRGQDNALWQRTLDAAAGGWNAWALRGGTLNSGPDAASWTSGRLDVFALGRLNDMWHRYFDAAHGGWGPWESIGGTFTSDPGVASWGPGRLDIFARGPQVSAAGLAMHKFYDAGHGGWGTWEAVPASPTLSTGPDASSWGTGRLDAFAQGTDNTTRHVTYQGGWSAWETLAGSSTSDPGAVSWGPGRIDVFVRAADNTIVHKYFANGAWSAGWTPN